MSITIYCSGTFVGQRVFHESVELNKREENELKLTLCLTPTKEYPSLFGGAYNQLSSTSNIIHGSYDGITQEAKMNEIQNGISIYNYQCKLTIDKSNKINYLYGTWKSLIDSNLFGKLAMVCVVDQPSDVSSGIWIGESIPDEELADFYLPINPIRWCFTIFKENNNIWKLFGSGYFNDSADIPDQPLLFFSLDGHGTLDDMTVIKKYTTTDYMVEYRGKFIQYDQYNLQFQGRWSNSLAGSYGSFLAEQRQLNPLISYRLDICICEVCRNAIHPGDNRWCCFQCNFSTCCGCNLNSIAVNHEHKLVVDILPNQNTAHGNTSLQLVENAFKVFDKTSFLIYRSFETDQFISMSYGQMSIKCKTLAKYWKQFVKNANDENRPIILLICDTSPAYICCLLTGILLQSVLLPINGSLNIDAIQHTLKTTNPSIIVIGQQYIEKISSILSSDQKQISMIIYQNEEQFDQIITNNNEDIISLTKALQFGEQNEININPSIDLSNKTISAILSTSGSTGYPKGAIFTEELIIPNDSFTLISPFIRIDYQPFDPVLLLSLMSTIKYGSCRGLTNLNEMWNDIKIIKPTSIGLTPSLWNIIYKNYLTKLNRNTTQLEEEQIQKEIREDLGGRLIVGTTGGGAISPTVFHFIKNKLKIDLVDVYGCRECGNIAKNGFIYPGIDVKLIPVKDIEEFDGIKQGEICVHSPKMIQGYWGMEHKSSFIEIQGKIYYKTGDIGQLEGNTIKLLDRSGTMIKNIMGEWISPVKIENIIEQLSQISSSFVMGDSNYSYLMAIICPSTTGLHLNELDILQLIRFHCTHLGLSGPEIPQRIFIEKNIIWNQENGLFKEKKSRHALTKYYSQIKNNIYNQLFIPTTIDSNHQLNQEFIQILENILNRPLKGQINGQNTFIQIGGDSLAISLLRQIYFDKGIYIDSAILYNHSLDHLQDLFNNQYFIYSQIIEDINWKDQSKLPTYFKELIRNSKNIKNKNILLTGATGFLGPILLHEIIQKTDTSTIIYCLIRAKDNEHAKQRLINDLEKCQRIDLIDWNRIKCIHGDVSKEYCGLELHFYNKLIEEIGFIYHNASIVNLDMTYKSLKSSNVNGTLNILEFALKSNAKLIYTSSISALSSDSQLKEDLNGWISLTSNEINKKDGYGQTKVVVEQILKQANDLGANIIIIRPGTISSDTLTGFSNLNDFIYILLRTQFELNTIVQNSNINFHFVPVDYCAKIIVALAMNEETRGKCFNLYGDPFNISIIYQVLFKKFPEKIFNQIKQNEWKQFLLNNLSQNNKSWILKDQLASFQFIQEDQQLKQQGVNMKMTKHFLENKLNIQWFQLNEQHFIKSIDYLIQQHFFN
jgi:thioester reductase-like protein